MKDSKANRHIPFSVQPSANVTRQVADGIRAAIRSGFWKPGDTLPRARDFQQELGVGGYVPRTALRSLADEGTIVLKRHVGAIVPKRSESARRQRIAFITSGTRDAHYENVHAFTLQEIFARAGYELIHILLPPERDEKRDGAFDGLLGEIARGLDFAICFTGSRLLAKKLDAGGVRYLYETGTGRDFPNAVATITPELASETEFLRFAEFWKSSGVRHAAIVDFEHVLPRNLLESLSSAGITITRLMETSPSDDRRIKSVQAAGLQAVASFFAQAGKRVKAPDAIFFYDDYLAQGGLIALAATGLRVPEDLRVATLANRGSGPVWFKPLTRLEYDPIGNARQIGSYVLKILGGKDPVPPKLPLAFIPGKT